MNERLYPPEWRTDPIPCSFCSKPPVKMLFLCEDHNNGASTVESIAWLMSRVKRVDFDGANGTISFYHRGKRVIATSLIEAVRMGAELEIEILPPSVCTTPTGRTDSHGTYVKRVNDVEVCMFCEKPV